MSECVYEVTDTTKEQSKGKHTEPRTRLTFRFLAKLEVAPKSDQQKDEPGELKEQNERNKLGKEKGTKEEKKDETQVQFSKTKTKFF